MENYLSLVFKLETGLKQLIQLGNVFPHKMSTLSVRKLSYSIYFYVLNLKTQLYHRSSFFHLRFNTLLRQQTVSDACCENIIQNEISDKNIKTFLWILNFKLLFSISIFVSNFFLNSFKNFYSEYYTPQWWAKLVLRYNCIILSCWWNAKILYKKKIPNKKEFFLFLPFFLSFLCLCNVHLIAVHSFMYEYSSSNTTYARRKCIFMTIYEFNHGYT